MAAYNFAAQKAALTRAIKTRNREVVKAACQKAVREWDGPDGRGYWPDDWARWQRALDDVYDWGGAPLLDDLRAFRVIVVPR